MKFILLKLIFSFNFNPTNKRCCRRVINFLITLLSTFDNSIIRSLSKTFTLEILNNKRVNIIIIIVKLKYLYFHKKFYHILSVDNPPSISIF